MTDEWDYDEAMEDAMVVVRNRLEDARAALTRPERSPAEAINHIERALEAIAEFVK